LLGIGGGGVFVPLLILCAGFSAKEAVPVSNAIIFGVVVINNIQLMRLRHPTVSRMSRANTTRNSNFFFQGKSTFGRL
jgi:uncharacterized membrane protein YfcA